MESSGKGQPFICGRTAERGTGQKRETCKSTLKKKSEMRDKSNLEARLPAEAFIEFLDDLDRYFDAYGNFVLVVQAAALRPTA